mgnify:CR=1 FL=1
MAIDDTAAAGLRDYQAQLIKLDLDDIRIPNQSLILDYFCTDRELTEFLRNEVFLESSKRHNAWKKVNQRSTHDIKIEVDDEVSHLLDCGNSHASRVWADIVKLTAKQQAHDDIAQYIVIHSSRKLKTVLGPEHQETSKQEQWSQPPIDQANADNNLRVIPSTQESQNTVVRTAAPDPNSANGKPLLFLIGTLVVMGVFGALLTATYEPATTTQSAGYPNQGATDNSDNIMALERLEADQKDAILICEHKPIIEKAKSLDLVETGNIARRDALIASSDKQIAFLDQKSTKNYKYSEDPSCTWGSQWFDNANTDGAWRAFIAVSKKCTSPVINYGITKTGDSSDMTLIGKRQIPLGDFEKGEVRLPYFDAYGYAFIEGVSCSA